MGLSAWLFAAEARGRLPSGQYDASLRVDWLVTPEHAAAIRRDAFMRAGVRLPGPLRGIRPPAARAFTARDPADREGPPRTQEFDPPEPLTCRYRAQPPSGTSAKFDCVLDGGEIVKVKYGRNPEIHAEAAATALLRALDYPADIVAIVERTSRRAA